MKVSNAKKIRKRLLSAHDFLSASSTTAEKIESLQELLQGINPKLDKKLEALAEIAEKIEEIQEKKVIHLTSKALPEKTKKQKKRKKLLLLFLKYYDELQDEVQRVKLELEKMPHSSPTQKASGLAKVTSLAKGPLGLITVGATIIAAGLITLNTSLTLWTSSCSSS